MSVNVPTILGMAVCAMLAAALCKDWSFSNVGNDVKLLLIAIVACWVSLRLWRRAAQQKDPPEDAMKENVLLDTEEQVKLMYRCAWERNISGAMGTFQRIKDSGAGTNSRMFNTVLQACINCGNVQAAEEWMEEMKAAGMVDQLSFDILIKGLVASHTWDKAYKILIEDTKAAGVEPSASAFDDVLCGLARENQFHHAIALLEERQRCRLPPSSVTKNAVTKLLNASRDLGLNIVTIEKLLRDYGLGPGFAAGQHVEGAQICIDCDLLGPTPLPALAAVISRARHATQCVHQICISGNLPQVKAARRTLKQLGFMDKQENSGGPMEGHWETERGLTVIIEGKTVRWSARHASRLRYTRQDRSACILALYGQSTHGHVVPASESHDGTKLLHWDNGDVWYPCDGRAVGQHVLLSQSMTRTLRDTIQDRIYRARTFGVLKCVSKQVLHMPQVFEDAIMQFLGNDLHYVSIYFQSRWNPSLSDEDDQDLPLFEANSDICVSISCRHPRVGLHHSWADLDTQQCGQRTWVNGEEIDDACFCRHVGAVYWA